MINILLKIYIKGTKRTFYVVFYVAYADDLRFRLLLVEGFSDSYSHLRTIFLMFNEREGTHISSTYTIPLFAGVILIGFFLLLSSTFTVLLLLPIYFISVYSVFKYVTSSHSNKGASNVYFKYSCFGLISIIFLSMFISAINPALRNTTPKGFATYSEAPTYSDVDSSPTSSRFPVRGQVGSN